MPSPLITVVLSAHNDAAFLPAAVQSILAQSFTDFELLAIDDGSTDSTGSYLDSIGDRRVRAIHNDRNIGLTASLNLAVAESRGRYIARMDADDIAEPDRLLRQFEFLENRNDIGILGSSRLVIDEQGIQLYSARATPGDLSIRWKCLLGNPFAHPTVMLRKELLDRHDLRYNTAFRTAQDYELWIRLLQHTRGENLDEPLLRYRRRAGISRLSRTDQLSNHDRIAQSAFQRILPQFPVSTDDVRQLRGRFGGFSVREADMNPADEKWLAVCNRMLDAFVAAHHGAPGIEVWDKKERAKISAIRGGGAFGTSSAA